MIDTELMAGANPDRHNLAVVLIDSSKHDGGEEWFGVFWQFILGLWRQPVSTSCRIQ